MNSRGWPLVAVTVVTGLSAALAADPPRPSGPMSPAEAARGFTVPPDLRFDQVLTEPIVRQPVSINFDERGRLWVVQYLQYPFPAGVKVLSRDQFWRVTYDKVPPPPPKVRGLDKITIHEDTHGTGVFDKHTTFLDGLNIATSAVRGRGGVWVLNPPYLLFYPTKDDADVPTGVPEVSLEGFGLEDTHSVVNSLHWGPDGWLYAAQGSTVTAAVRRPGSKDPPVLSEGQNIWRYHPETRRYEVFAEGGGNAFGVEFDAKGRLYSGHNGGNTRGFHYVQGGYYLKGFDKHGPLSNPYAFGYFPAMAHNTAPRFSHTFAFAESAVWPEKYRDQLFGVVPLKQEVILSAIGPDRSSRKTHDLGPVVSTNDSWFRPVDVKLGPDGSLYVADWYDGQLAHLHNTVAGMDRGHGRVYRLRPENWRPVAPFDLKKKTTDELIELLDHENKWYRQTALRLLGDRKDRTALPRLEKLTASAAGQTALEALWALNLCGGFTEANALKALGHTDPHVRLWAVRLICDDNRVSSNVSDRLTELSHGEPEVEVRSQLACSARRLRAGQSLPIVARLLRHDEDAGDIHVPMLLWWAVEAKCGSDRVTVLDLFRDSTLWQHRIVADTILPRLMRRFAQPADRENLQACVELFRLAPDQASGRRLMQGFEQAFQGRSVAGLPAELLEQTARFGGGSLSLRLRQGTPEAIAEALKLVANPKAKWEERLACIETFGEVHQPGCVPVLLALVRGKDKSDLRRAALTALQHYDDPTIGTEVLALHDASPQELRGVAVSLLVSRKAWARQLLDAVDAGRFAKDALSINAVRKLLTLRDEHVSELVRKHWGDVRGATTDEMRREVERLTGVLTSGLGDPFAGRTLFTAACASCHTLHGQGGQVGPDLTTYRRDDIPVMLLNVVNPSAEIREGYENNTVVTERGRVVNGLLVEKDAQKVVIRTAEGEKVTIARADVAEMTVSGVSLMPEGLLKNLTDQQVRDLYAYLRTTQPLKDPPK